MTELTFKGARLYGLPHSYYTIIARSYLRINQFGVSEVSSRHPDFLSRVYPKIKRGIIPVLELEDGRVIQDSLDIIEAGDSLAPRFPGVPEDASMKALAYLVFLYGSQALLKPAMHYRWTFYPEQKEFLDHAFGLKAGDPSSSKVMDKMRSYLPILGVTHETVPHIEAAFIELLHILNAHFAEYPFALGNKPTLADYGLLGPLFAHLGRDPVPETIMKRVAPNVYRWTERMNTGVFDTPEYSELRPDFSFDDLPKTLISLFEFIGRDYGDELSDRVSYIRDWQAENAPEDGDPVSIKPSQRAIGVSDVRYRGQTVAVAIQPYLIYIQRRIENAIADSSADHKNRITGLLAKNSLESVISPGLTHTVGRINNVEVWEKV